MCRCRKNRLERPYNIQIQCSATTIRTGSFFRFWKVILSIYLIWTGWNFPNGKSNPYKMELELKYGFWNLNFFRFDRCHNLKVSCCVVLIFTTWSLRHSGISIRPSWKCSPVSLVKLHIFQIKKSLTHHLKKHHGRDKWRNLYHSVR